jgi:hypothetical protein
LAASAEGRAKSAAHWCATPRGTGESGAIPLPPGASKPESCCPKTAGGVRPNASGGGATWRPPAPPIGTSPSNRSASPQARNGSNATSSRPMTPRLPLSSKARATAPPSLAARPASCLRPLLAFSLPIGGPRAIPGTRALCCPCSTRGTTPCTLSPPHTTCGATLSGVTWGARTPSCARPCMRAACSPWAFLREADQSGAKP